MKKLILMSIALVIFGPVVDGEGALETAKAELRNAAGDVIGQATLSQQSEGVRIALEVSHLPPGIHAFHVHAAGKCDPPDFKSAGSHFNPTGKKHGRKNPEGAHVGDLPNLTIGADGTGRADVLVEEVTLGEGANSLFHPEGTSLVIHANMDDEVTDPTGNAGARIACGVIST